MVQVGGTSASSGKSSAKHGRKWKRGTLWPTTTVLSSTTTVEQPAGASFAKVFFFILLPTALVFTIGGAALVVNAPSAVKFVLLIAAPVAFVLVFLGSKDLPIDLFRRQSRT